ncbi:MAG: TonB C-terminal domain-containing protein, partial [Bacteroidota bacterium]
LLFLLFINSVFSQSTIYELYGTQTNPYASLYSLITLDTLKDARTLKDIYANYRPDWVANYIEVVVKTTCNGVDKTAASPNDTLTQNQLTLLRQAVADCNIEITVDYIPNNELTYNPARTMTFSLRTMPIVEAKFPGGKEQLQSYLEQHIVNKISPSTFEQIQFTSIQFNITKDGQVADVLLIDKSDNSEVDQLLLTAICNMPQWQPAKDVEGANIIQSFQFNLGTDLLRCDYRYKF